LATLDAIFGQIRQFLGLKLLFVNLNGVYIPYIKISKWGKMGQWLKCAGQVFTVLEHSSASKAFRIEKLAQNSWLKITLIS